MESAAIQTFPRDYKFCGSKSAIYTQIENAVPCRLAESVAAAVAEVIFGKRRLHNEAECGKCKNHGVSCL